MSAAFTSWERLSGGAGGTVGGLTASIMPDRTLVFAATSAGVHRSADSGRSWALAGPGTTPPFAEAVAASPDITRDHTVFACASDGLHRSSDNGESWRRVLGDSRVLSLAVAPGTAHGSVLIVGTETDGALRSEDGGGTWASANAGLLDLTVLALAVSPQFASDRFGFLGTPSGLYRTRNSAKSWRAMDLGVVDPAIQCLAVSPAFHDDRLVLAGTDTGLLRSDDAGTTWRRVFLPEGEGITAIAFSPGYAARRTVAVATEAGVAVSNDAGQSWRITSPGAGPALSLTFVAHEAEEALLAGLHRRGVARSDDDGATWSQANVGLGAQLRLGLALSPDFARDSTIFVADLENGVVMSGDAGHTWVNLADRMDSSAVFAVALSPAYAVDRTVYAATAEGVLLSRDGGANWHRSCRSPESASVVTTTPASKLDTSRFVLTAVGHGRLLASDDGATTWRSLGSAFKGSDIVALAPSPDYARDGTIFVATSGGSADGSKQFVVWRSADRGQHWERWLVEPERIAGPLILAISPTYADDQILFVALNGRVLQPSRDTSLARPHEHAPSWHGTSFGESALTVISLAISPNYSQDRTIFVGTNAGVFLSRDGDYQLWSEEMILPRIVGLALSPSYADDGLVYALGLGGDVWRRRCYLSPIAPNDKSHL